MQESHSKELAIHTGPESCVGCRKADDEALTGVHAGQVFSCEINYIRGADAVCVAEGNTGRGASASRGRTPRSRRP
jgi:hypothetical protein